MVLSCFSWLLGFDRIGEERNEVFGCKLFSWEFYLLDEELDLSAGIQRLLETK